MDLSTTLMLGNAALPLTCWLINAVLLRRYVHWMLLFCLVWMSSYGILLLTVQVVEADLQREMYRHDLDGDGGFSEDELTVEAQRAIDAVVTDTGRRLAPVTGVPITFIWTTINFVAIYLTDWVARLVWRSMRGRRNRAGPADLPGEELPGGAVLETGNPYQPPASAASSLGESNAENGDEPPE